MIPELSFLSLAILIVLVVAAVLSFVMSLDKKKVDAILKFLVCTFLILLLALCVVAVMPECKNKIYYYCPEYVR